MDVHWLQLVVYIVVYSLEMVTGFVTFFFYLFLVQLCKRVFRWRIQDEIVIKFGWHNIFRLTGNSLLDIQTLQNMVFFQASLLLRAFRLFGIIHICIFCCIDTICERIFCCNQALNVVIPELRVWPPTQCQCPCIASQIPSIDTLLFVRLP